MNEITLSLQMKIGKATDPEAVGRTQAGIALALMRNALRVDVEGATELAHILAALPCGCGLCLSIHRSDKPVEGGLKGAVPVHVRLSTVACGETEDLDHTVVEEWRAGVDAVLGSAEMNLGGAPTTVSRVH